MRRVGQDWWFTLRLAEGPALVHCRLQGDGVLASADGPSAEHALERLPRMLGCHDEPPPWTRAQGAAHAKLLDGRQCDPLGAHDDVPLALVGAILEQKVTGDEAYASWRHLVNRFGEPADFGRPEASGMRVVPDLAGWRAIPGWAWTSVGVDARRARTIRVALDRASALERHRAQGSEALGRALLTLPGVGAWTVAKVRQQALGDANAWTIDDYHVPSAVIGFFTGRRPTPHRSAEDFAATRAEAEALLEPFVPHRFRAELLILAAGWPERHGPRRSLPRHLPGGPGRRATG